MIKQLPQCAKLILKNTKQFKINLSYYENGALTLGRHFEIFLYEMCTVSMSFLLSWRVLLSLISLDAIQVLIWSRSRCGGTEKL